MRIAILFSGEKGNTLTLPLHYNEKNQDMIYWHLSKPLASIPAEAISGSTLKIKQKLKILKNIKIEGNLQGGSGKHGNMQ